MTDNLLSLNNVQARRFSNVFLSVFTAVVMGISIFTSGAFAQKIEGPTTTCKGSTEKYEYCRVNNFPYDWIWTVTPNTDASFTDLGTNDSCYFVDVKLGLLPTTLTFIHYYPVGLPQVANVTKYISPKDCAMPAVPTATNATNVTPNSFTANWNASPNVTGYLLDVSKDSNFNSPVFKDLALGKVTSFNVTRLAQATPYHYRVRAVNLAGKSGYSNSIQPTTRTSAPVVPSAPVATAATLITSNSFTANWNTSPGATGYLLDVSTSPNFEPRTILSGYNRKVVNGASSLKLPVTLLSQNTRFYYRVYAVNAAGTSENYSQTIPLTTAPGPITIPVAPTALAATNIASDNFMAPWSVSPGATEYRLDVSKTPNFALPLFRDNVKGSGVSHNVTQLTPGTDYYYRFRGVNGTVKSINSNTVKVTTAAKGTSAPPNLTQITTLGSKSFTAAWNPSPGATSYRLDVSTNSNFRSFVPGYQGVNVLGTSVRVSGLTPVTFYYYRVRSVNMFGISFNSDVDSVQTEVPCSWVGDPDCPR